MIARILATIRDEVSTNQTWYAILGYVIASAIVTGTREHTRIARVIDATRADLDARADEITERMTRAVDEETNARVSGDWDH